MGRKMDALLRRGFRASKFKILAKLAVSRLAILKNQRRARSSTARSDVIELLNLGQQDRALLRVEQVIKEQNMLDVFGMMEDFIHLLTERLVLLQDNKECPDELEEAISSLIFAATRCGEFPELKQIRQTFTSRFGKDFAARATELRNNCRVNSKMIQKLSTRTSTLENRLQMLKQIASESNITLHLEEQAAAAPEPKRIIKHNLSASGDHETNSLAEKLSESIKANKFLGVADAAQEAFEAAIYAAAAARAAVELSRSHFPDINDVHEQKNNSPNNSSSSEAESLTTSLVLSKKLSLHREELERTVSVSSTDSESKTKKDTEMAPNVPNQSEQCRDIVVYESYNEATESEGGNKGSDEDSNNELPQVDSMNIHDTMERKWRSFSDLGQKLCTQHSGIDRKLLSVRTIGVIRG